jgi:hypothetical protein
MNLDLLYQGNHNPVPSDLEADMRPRMLLSFACSPPFAGPEVVLYMSSQVEIHDHVSCNP